MISSSYHNWCSTWWLPAAFFITSSYHHHFIIFISPHFITISSSYSYHIISYHIIISSYFYPYHHFIIIFISNHHFIMFISSSSWSPGEPRHVGGPLHNALRPGYHLLLALSYDLTLDVDIILVDWHTAGSILLFGNFGPFGYTFYHLDPFGLFCPLYFFGPSGPSHWASSTICNSVTLHLAFLVKLGSYFGYGYNLVRLSHCSMPNL